MVLGVAVVIVVMGVLLLVLVFGLFPVPVAGCSSVGGGRGGGVGFRRID